MYIIPNTIVSHWRTTATNGQASHCHCCCASRVVNGYSSRQRRLSEYHNDARTSREFSCSIVGGGGGGLKYITNQNLSRSTTENGDMLLWKQSNDISQNTQRLCSISDWLRKAKMSCLHRNCLTTAQPISKRLQIECSTSNNIQSRPLPRKWQADSWPPLRVMIEKQRERGDDHVAKW